MQNDYLNTNDFAAKLGVKGQSVRRALCLAGHYMGVRPVKLPNGRLLWPAERLNRLTSGEVAQ